MSSLRAAADERALAVLLCEAAVCTMRFAAHGGRRGCRKRPSHRIACACGWQSEPGAHSEKRRNRSGRWHTEGDHRMGMMRAYASTHLLHGLPGRHPT